MTKYLISFPSEAMVLTEEELVQAGVDSRAVIEEAKAIREAGNGKRAVLVSAIMRCNYAEDQYYTQFTMVTFAGKRSLGRSVVAQGNCVGMFPTRTEVLVEPGSLKKGTKLTLKVRGRSTMDSTVRWGGAAIKKANGPVTTLHLTWNG